MTVPLNTMLADLDESLRTLLRRELSGLGFDGVGVVFDAPTKEWAAALTTPTVDLFLYDMQEALDWRQVEWTSSNQEGRVHEGRPPLRLDASFAVTAWTRIVEDEHRLLSQVLAVLYAHPELPSDVLSGALQNGSQPYPLTTRVAQARSAGKADFWSAVGGQYKASLDYVVSVSCQPGTDVVRGPEVRTQTIRAFRRDAPSAIDAVHRVGGVVSDAEGATVVDAWVALPELGRFTTTDAHGHYRFEGVPDGEHRCEARGQDGTWVKGLLAVPGSGLDLVLTVAERAGARRRRSSGN